MRITVKESVRCVKCGDKLAVCFKEDANASTYYCNNDNCDRLGLVSELALDQIEDKVVHV